MSRHSSILLKGWSLHGTRGGSTSSFEPNLRDSTTIVCGHCREQDQVHCAQMLKDREEVGDAQ